MERTNAPDMKNTLTGISSDERQMRTIFYGGSNGRGLFTQEVVHKRVAAYCRVSTAMDTQATSLETQMSVFRQRIMEHSGWELVGVYADEGLSGTSVRKRKEFLRMIEDCEAGKIDYIITKSISRFARNTLECLSYVRHLQSLGIQILFEKENLDTGSAISEMLLTVLAAFAQEESHSISQNILWGIRRGFEMGHFRWHEIFGYRCDKDGNWLIEETEAVVVRRIFDLYEHGASRRQIASLLNHEGLKTIRGNKWCEMTVGHILKNEKYKGDAELQKTYTIDFLLRKKIRNDATEIPRYYISNHHQAIVSAEAYDRVQKIAAMKDTTGNKQPSYPFGCYDLQCPICGSPLIPINTGGFGNKRMAYGCFLEDGCSGFALRRYCLSQAILKGYNEVDMKDIQELEQENVEVMRFLQFKREEYEMTEVEFYWLDALIEGIEVVRLPTRIVRKKERNAWAATIYWRCGMRSVVPIDFKRHENDPFVVANLYKKHLAEAGLYTNAELRIQEYENNEDCQSKGE